MKETVGDVGVGGWREMPRGMPQLAFLLNALKVHVAKEGWASGSKRARMVAEALSNLPQQSFSEG